MRVELVDTGAASFVVGLAALAAAECLAAGRSAVEAAAAAARVAKSSGNVFVVGALDLARAGGRLAGGTHDATTGSVPVLRLLHGEMSVIGQAEGVEDAAAQMAAEILAAGDRLRVGLSVADSGARSIVDELRRRLEAAPAELELLEYRVGPSVGAHTGPCTAGAVYHPI